MRKPVDLARVKAARKDAEYRNLVLKVFDDMEHAERRERHERRADIERLSRQRL